jgi:hypothetical protein
VFEKSRHVRPDAVSGGWTLLVNLDRHYYLAWRLYETKGIRRPLGVGRTRGFISIIGPDNSEIGTVTLEPVNELRHPFEDPSLTLQDAAGTRIGHVKRVKRARTNALRAILNANGVEVGRIETFERQSTVIQIDPTMPDVLRCFVFPLENLFREWGRAKSSPAVGTAGVGGG